MAWIRGFDSLRPLLMLTINELHIIHGDEKRKCKQECKQLHLSPSNSKEEFKEHGDSSPILALNWLYLSGLVPEQAG